MFVVKGIVHPKIKIAWKSTQYVDGFVSSLEQVLRNVALHHLLTNG